MQHIQHKIHCGNCMSGIQEVIQAGRNAPRFSKVIPKFLNKTLGFCFKNLRVICVQCTVIRINLAHG